MLRPDRHLEHWIVAHRVDSLNWVFLWLSRIGTLGAIWLAIGAVLAIVWRRPWIVVEVGVALGVADLLTSLIKLVVHRHRPFEHQIGPSERTHSFPSGHTSTSFAAATVLAGLLPRYRWWFYALALLIGFSRLYNGVHYPTDVLAGAVLGVATALLLRATIRRRSHRALPRG